MKQIFLFHTFLTFSLSRAAHLPSYITPCRLSDPNFSQCASNSANKAISAFIKGDKKYKIQNLDPIVIPEIKLEANSDSRLLLKNVTTSDLKRSRITDFRLHPNEKSFVSTGAIDRLEMASHYDVQGVLLSTGTGNVTFINSTYVFRANYTLRTNNGEEYLSIIDRKFDFTVGRGYFYFYKIFGDNEQLTEEFNKSINENWDLIAKSAFPFFAKVMESVTESVMNGIFKNVPFKEIFLP